MSHNTLLSVGESSTIKTFLICMTASFRQFGSRGDARRVGMAVHGLDERLFGEWLGEVLIRPRELAARAVENSVLARQHDDGCGFERGILFDQRAGLVAIESRHHDVDKDDLR